MKKFKTIQKMLLLLLSIAFVNSIFNTLPMINNATDSCVNLSHPISAAASTVRVYVDGANQSYTIRDNNFTLNGYTEKLAIVGGQPVFQKTGGLLVYPIIDGQKYDGNEAGVNFQNLTLLSDPETGVFNISFHIPSTYKAGDIRTNLTFTANITQMGSGIYVYDDCVRTPLYSHEVTSESTSIQLIIPNATPLLPGDIVNFEFDLYDEFNIQEYFPTGVSGINTNSFELYNGDDPNDLIPSTMSSFSDGHGEGSFVYEEDLVSIYARFIGYKTLDMNSFYEYKPCNSTTIPLTRTLNIQSNNLKFINQEDILSGNGWKADEVLLEGNITVNINHKLMSRSLQVYQNETLLGIETTDEFGFFSYPIDTTSISDANQTLQISLQLMGYDTTLGDIPNKFHINLTYGIQKIPLPAFEVVEIPADAVEGTEGIGLTWQAVDRTSHPNPVDYPSSLNYTIYKENSIEVQSGIWNPGNQLIYLIPSNLSVGTHQYSLYVYDSVTGLFTGGVPVVRTENVKPIVTITSKMVYTQVQNVSEIVISWSITDPSITSSANYTIYRKDTINVAVQSGIWVSGQNISFTLAKNSAVGTFEYFVVVSDGYQLNDHLVTSEIIKVTITSPKEITQSNWAAILIPIGIVVGIIVGITIFQRKRMDLAHQRDLGMRKVNKNAKLAIVENLFSNKKGREAIAYSFHIYLELINLKFRIQREPGVTIRELSILLVTKYGQDPLRLYPYIQYVEGVLYGAIRVDQKAYQKALQLFGRLYSELTGIQLEYSMPASGDADMQDLKIEVKEPNPSPLDTNTK